MMLFVLSVFHFSKDIITCAQKYGLIIYIYKSYRILRLRWRLFFNLILKAK